MLSVRQRQLQGSLAKETPKVRNRFRFWVKNARTLWMSPVYPSSNYLKMTIFSMIQLLLSQKNCSILECQDYDL